MGDEMSTSTDLMTLTTMTATDALQTCTEVSSEWQQEIARFVDLRLAENRRSLEELMAARDIAGLLQVQQQWGLHMAADYMNEASRLTHLFTTLALTGTIPAVQKAAMLVG
jgi:hypothetical protein